MSCSRSGLRSACFALMPSHVDVLLTLFVLLCWRLVVLLGVRRRGGRQSECCLGTRCSTDRSCRRRLAAPPVSWDRRRRALACARRLSAAPSCSGASIL